MPASPLHRVSTGERLNTAETTGRLQQTLGAAPFWVLPNRYEEAMQAVHEARPVVLQVAAELGRSYRGFAKKLGLDGQPDATAQPAVASRHK